MYPAEVYLQVLSVSASLTADCAVTVLGEYTVVFRVLIGGDCMGLVDHIPVDVSHLELLR